MRTALRREIASIEKQIDGFLDTIADAASTTAVRAYERRIERLETDKLRMEDQLATVGVPKGTPAENLEPALQFFSNPWKVWASGRPELRRLVLRLGLSEPLAYCRETGPRTPKTSLPFSMLGGVQQAEVRGGGPSLTDLEPLLDVLEDWSEQLKGVDLSEFARPDTGASLDPELTDDDLPNASAAQSPSEPGGPS